MKYVYVLKLKNHLYTGCTKRLRERISEHKRGKVRSTNKMNPVLILYEAYIYSSDADRRERFLKTAEGKEYLRRQLRDYLTDAGIV